MSDDITSEIDKVVRAGIEAFIRSDDEKEDKKEDKKPEEKKDDAPKDEPAPENEEKEEKKDDAADEKKEGDDTSDTPAAPPIPEETEPLPEGPIDFSAMSDDELVMFIEMAADRLGLNDVIDGDDEPASEEIAEAAADAEPGLPE